MSDDKPNKRRVGRPLKTTEDLPENWKDIILKMSAEGCSECEIRAALATRNKKFSIGLWYALKERDNEFLETLKEAKSICQAWWEKKGRQNLATKGFNSTLWIMNMKNRFPAYWKDKHEHEHSGDIVIKKVMFNE